MGEPTSQERTLAETAAEACSLDEVRSWCAINSGSTNLSGLERTAALLADRLSTLPGTLTLRDPDPVTALDAAGREIALAHGKHLHLVVRPGAPRQMLLTGHMDTVYGADHPFQTVRDLPDGRVNGPGVADMKGGLAVMIAALQAFERHPGAGTAGYEVVINSDEEVGSASSASLIAQAARGKLAALTYEPSALPDGTLAGARPGSGNFSFHIRGRSAHAGRNPEEGRNAVTAAAELALALEALRRDGLSVNVARLDGGSPNNVVPDLAILRVNLRPRTPDLEAAARAGIAAAVRQVAASRDVGVHVHGGFGRPPKPLDPPALKLFALVEQAGRDLGQTIARKDSGGVCDGNNIAACGVPVVDTMGVRGGAIHSEEEYLIPESLGERAALSALVLARLAGGAL
ncbi:glutamate carboxypeptidase [Sphingomonas kaistensis]|uniref:Glutamate carboxypeptidase n=1 Tax=Sphingomonas kaistensis TaxID=298708 RepID=A0A7X5Y9F7_9SPHN|nr:hydrolase [Sphingomonas kaistensis]NJC05951.1 glutamate carboxypeptidase [Sphingomonas kaistensis]